jgi:hypothetical protein
VLDPSLRGVGQHHFEYDVHVLRAAERQGWQPVLAAHRDLGQQRELADNWEIHRAFCEQHSEYRAAMERFWAGCRLTRGDQVFLATAMPSDLVGLANWARQNRSAGEVDWHLQFHFPLVDAEVWYADSSRRYEHQLRDVPQMLQDLIGVLGRDRVHLYATTEPLADQLTHCLGETFATLPVPINPALASSRAARCKQKPLRAICAGQPRSEKGGEHWSKIAHGLKADYFAAGRLQLALQAQSYEDLPDPLRRLAADFAAPVPGQPRQTPVDLAGWPLSPAAYLEFLASASVGLLMYDPLPYHARISGVMVELLGAGVPVIVPAGCALADQIAEPIFAHQEKLRDRHPVVANVATAQLDWKAVHDRAGRGITVGADAPSAAVPAAVAQTAVPAHASHLLILLERDRPNAWNRYCSVSVEQRAADGRPIQRSRDTIGDRGPGRRMTVLVPLCGQSQQIQIRLQTALGHEPFLLRRIDCCFLAAGESPVPGGAVGQLASDPSQAADALRDVVDHYDHYEQTARAFAADWATEHSAEQVLRKLTTRSAWSAPVRRRAA